MSEAEAKPAALVTHEDCGLHDTGWGHPEHMGRLPAIVKAIYRDTPALQDHILQHEAQHATEAQLARVHTSGHIELVRAAAAEAVRTGEIVRLDTETVVSPATWDAALAAAGCAVDAAMLTLSGRARNALALSRPPGHHATADRAMGFCLFNSAAVGAYHARAAHGLKRVAVVDFDVHHGNGTQDIFWNDHEMFYASTHQAPLYPGTGAANERGLDNILNVPLPPLADGEAFRHAFAEHLLPALTEFRPDLVIISAGFDAHKDDPLAALCLEEEDFAWATRELMRLAAYQCGGRLVSTLEGGYDLDALGRSAAAHVAALMGQ